MSSDNILDDLFSDDDSNRRLTIFLAFTIVAVLYHATVFWVVMADEIQSKNDVDVFSVSFEETSHIGQETRTIDDGDREVIEFEVPADMFSKNEGFGILLINISYDETSGQISDPCDTVAAELSPNEVEAEWQNEDNVLSGLSSDCNTISLKLHVYPGYDGQEYQAEGMDETHWKNQWIDDSWGQGEFHLEVEVNVNQPPTSPIPTISDDDEEVNITWEAIFFDVTVSQQ